MNARLSSHHIRTLALTLAVVLWVFAGAPAKADNLLVNPGFDLGNFNGWTLSGNLEGTNGGSYYGVGTQYPEAGSDEAYIGVDGSNLVLSQTVTVQPGAFYTISWWMAQTTTPDSNYTNSISVSFNGVTLLSLSQMAQQLTYQHEIYQYDVPKGITQATLQIAAHDDAGYLFLDSFYVGTPEPSTWVLSGVVLGALVWARARRRQLRY